MTPAAIGRARGAASVDRLLIEHRKLMRAEAWDELRDRLAEGGIAAMEAGAAAFTGADREAFADGFAEGSNARCLELAAIFTMMGSAANANEPADGMRH